MAGKRKKRVGPGDSLVVEAGVPHAFANIGDEVGYFVAEIEPAQEMRQLFLD